VRLLEWSVVGREMSAPDSVIENLRTGIEEAFSNADPPDSDNVIEHDCPECRAVRRVFRHQPWRKLKPEKIEWGHDKMSLFTPHAFQYFLPAFMLYALDEPSSIVCELLVNSLIVPKETEDWRKRLDEFTWSQKAACRIFLRWVQRQPGFASESDDIEKAIAERWQIESG
jgi:hypothetical protein